MLLASASPFSHTLKRPSAWFKSLLFTLFQPFLTALTKLLEQIDRIVEAFGEVNSHVAQ